MSWEAILKRNYVRNFQPEQQSDEWLEEVKDKYIVYIASQGTLIDETKGKYLWKYQGHFDSRQEAFDRQEKSFWEGGNPAPWTMEGNLYQGEAVVYDGAALVLGVPTYWYYIADGLDDIPPSNPEQEIRVDRHNPDRVMDRLTGRPFNFEKDELPTDFKDENR